MGTVTADATALLGELTGDPTADFRDGQLEAIRSLVDERRRVLVVQRTGWGKSAVYFIATRLLRDAGGGVTLLISPLLALMRNQLMMAARAGVRAESINSENTDDWTDIEERIAAGDVDLLLISPERLNNPRFRRDLLPGLLRSVGLLVVDEAHCISDWGHDFRPDYRRIARVLDLLPPTVPVLCTTATANDRVVADVVAQLGDSLHVLRGPLERDSLSLSVLELPQPAQRLAWLADTIPTLTGCGIVYCLTIADTERVAGWLRTKGIDAVAYSGESDVDARVMVEQNLLSNDVKAVVATSALGMGFDKPDLAWIVHFQSPGSPIAYYQQIGRAGRALEHSQAVLLRGTEDGDIQDYFIRVAFPPRDKAERLIALLDERGEPVTITEIEGEVNARRSRLEGMLKVLEVDGAIQRADRGWARTTQPWTYDDDRVQRVTAQRRVEQEAMREYGRTTACLMEFLRKQLDDGEAVPCGRCANCTGNQWSTDLDPALVAEAIAYLRTTRFVIEPRKRWAAGPGLPKGTIKAESRHETGRALGLYGDGGWGSVVKRARRDGKPMPRELVEAAAHLVDAWSADPAPTWVTFVPSASAPGVVADFAARLADAVGLPLHDVVRRTRDGRPQSEMENSSQQFANVYGAFDLAASPPDGPVLLVDDVVDSRWTLTVVAEVLRAAGVTAVHPFVLAKSMSD